MEIVTAAACCITRFRGNASAECAARPPRAYAHRLAPDMDLVSLQVLDADGRGGLNKSPEHAAALYGEVQAEQATRKWDLNPEVDKKRAPQTTPFSGVDFLEKSYLQP
jgi:hypothetical protein